MRTRQERVILYPLLHAGGQSLACYAWVAGHLPKVSSTTAHMVSTPAGEVLLLLQQGGLVWFRKLQGAMTPIVFEAL